MSTPNSACYEFGPFRLEVAEGRLLRDGEPVTLRAKVFDTLVYLVENPGRLLDKEELLEAVWPDAVVEESNLAHNISVLRKALGAHGAEYVETVPKRGYRFLAEVRQVAAPAVAGSEGDALEGARRAVRESRWADALEGFRAAEGAAALGPADLEAMAEAARWSGGHDEVLDLLERACAAYEEAGDRPGAARAVLRAAHVRWDRLEVALVAAHVQRARSLLEEVPTVPEHGLLEWLAGRCVSDRGDLDAALEHARRASEIGRRTGSSNVEALGLADEGHALLALGRAGEARPRIEAAGALALSGDLEPLAAGMVFCAVVFAYRCLGEWRQAGQWTEAFTRWCDRRRTGYFPGLCRVHLGEVIRFRGELEAAEEEMRRGCEELLAASPRFAGFGYQELGEIRLRLGDLAGAREAFRRALELGTDPQPGLARLCLLEGEPRSGMMALKRAAAYEQTLLRENRPYLLPVLVSCAIGCGDLDEARVALAQLEELTDACDSLSCRASLHGARGELALAEGRAGEALDDLQRSWRIWSELEAPWEAARTRLLAARARREEGDALQARLELEAVLAVFERLGARLDAEGTRKLLAELDGSSQQAG